MAFELDSEIVKNFAMTFLSDRDVDLLNRYETAIELYRNQYGYPQTDSDVRLESTQAILMVGDERVIDAIYRFCYVAQRLGNTDGISVTNCDY